MAAAANPRLESPWSLAPIHANMEKSFVRRTDWVLVSVYVVHKPPKPLHFTVSSCCNGLLQAAIGLEF